MSDSIPSLFLDLIQSLHQKLLVIIDRVEHAENIEVLVGLATIVIVLAVVLWLLNLIKSILGASVHILEHTVNVLKRIAKYSGFALIFFLLIYYIFGMKRQCFTAFEKNYTSCLEEAAWENKRNNHPSTSPNNTPNNQAPLNPPLQNMTGQEN